jgi:hypothetical protein
VDTQHLIITEAVAFDTGKGLVGNIFGQKGSNIKTQITDSYVYGESETVRDCPSQDFCSTASANLKSKICHSKFGTILPVHVEAAKAPLVLNTRDLPIESQRANSAFAGSSLYRNVHFTDFKSNTYCGNKP